jgi:hypothetical protein
VHGPDDRQRLEVEEFVRRVFARRYQALVPAFAPVLVSVCDPTDGRIVAAAGYRNAQHGPLFLERYLGAPIESLLAAHSTGATTRDDIVEIGHLAADRAGAGRRLMFLLGPHLARQGFKWGVFTLTQELRQMVSRLGIAPLALAKADPSVLTREEMALWGSYYQHEPVVVAGEMQQALRRFAPRRDSSLAK